MSAAIAYPLAALTEIAGCFAIWAWWRLGASSLWLAPGILSLVAFGWLLTEPVELARPHLVAAFGEADATALLAGRPDAAMPDGGPIVCACFDVGLKGIVHAVASGCAASVAEIGAALRAGTNCGSCRPELAALLATVSPKDCRC